MKKFILLLLAATLAACARAPLAPVSEGESARAWQEMQAASDSVKGPYRLQLSMRFGEEGDTRRVTGILWGNGDDALRLDVMAGVGATIAKIAEAGDDFLVYLPRENKAYFHQGANRPLLKVGVPVPFDLAQLADLLTGRFASVFGKEPAGGEALADGGAIYELEGALAGELRLNQRGYPVSWKQRSGGWQLDLGYDDEAPGLPDSLKLANINGKRAIVLVKEREATAAPFAPSQLELAIPAEVTPLPLEQFKTTRG